MPPDPHIHALRNAALSKINAGGSDAGDYTLWVRDEFEIHYYANAIQSLDITLCGELVIRLAWTTESDLAVFLHKPGSWEDFVLSE